MFEIEVVYAMRSLFQERVKVFLKNPVTEQMEAVGALLPTHGVVWYVAVWLLFLFHK